MEYLITLLICILICPLFLIFCLFVPEIFFGFFVGIFFVSIFPIFIIYKLCKKIDSKFVISKYRKRLVLMNKTKQLIHTVDSQIYWVKGNEAHEKLKKALNNLSKEDYDLVKDHYSKFVGIIK